MSSVFAPSWIPVGIQTLDAADMWLIPVTTGFDPTAVNVADLAGLEAGPRIACTGALLRETTGWQLGLDGLGSSLLTAPMLGAYLAKDAGSDATMKIVGYDDAALASGTFEPSFDDGFIFQPFESRTGVQTVTAGTGITNTGTATNPILNAVGGGGGAVTSDDVTILDGPGGDPIATLTEVDLPSFFDRIVTLEDTQAARPWLDPVRVVATSPTGAVAGDVIDGVTLAADDRVLQTANGGTDNRVFVVQPSGGPSLPGDKYRSGTTVRVAEGTTYAGSVWYVSNPAPFDPTIDTITWAEDASSGGSGDVSGPGSAVTADRIVLWSGTTGTDIKQASVGVAGLQPINAGLTAISALTTDAFGLALLTKTSSSAVRTYLGLVIGTDVLAPNGSGASLTGIPQSAVTSLVSDLAAKAPLASPALTGTPTAPTASAGTATTQVATTAFVGTAVGGSLALSTFDAKGDMIVASANDTGTKLTVGANDTMLMADSSPGTGMKWASPTTVKTALALNNVTNVAQANAAWFPTPIRKGTDQTYLSTATLVNDTALTFAVAASEEWAYRIMLLVFGSTAADCAVGLNGPTGCTITAGVTGPASTYSGAAASIQIQGVITASTAAGAAGFGTFGIGTTLAAASLIVIEGVIVNGANAGSLTVQHCQSVSTATNSNVSQFSTLSRTRIV